MPYSRCKNYTALGNGTSRKQAKVLYPERRRFAVTRVKIGGTRVGQLRCEDDDI